MTGWLIAIWLLGALLVVGAALKRALNQRLRDIEGVVGVVTGEENVIAVLGEDVYREKREAAS